MSATLRTIALTSCFLALAPTAWSARPAYCAHYAEQAVAQYKRMKLKAACRVPDGPRWQAAYETNFQTCYAGMRATMDDEQELRESHLKSCGAPANADGSPEPPAPNPIAGLPEPAPASFDPKRLPVGFLECDGNQCDQGHGGVWIFNGNGGVARWPDGAIAKLSIERFDDAGIVIRRIDTTNSSSPGFTALYTGLAKNGRYEGKVDAYWPNHFPKSTPPGMTHYTWFASVPTIGCADPQMSAPDAFEAGQVAVRFRKPQPAFHCFELAANQGDGQSKSLLGLMYRDGIGTAVDYPEALRWLKVAAIQGDYNAQVALSQMFALGVGTPADPKMAETWREQAFNNPLMVHQRQAAQQQAQSQQLMFMGFAAVLEAMSQPDVVVLY